LTGLINGTAYTFFVTATNSAGIRSPSASSASVTPVAPPTPPGAGGLTITSGNGQVTVSFAPSSSGGSGITYIVTATPVGGGTTIKTSGTTSPINVTGLRAGVTYIISVVAVNAGGSSSSSPAAQATVNGQIMISSPAALASAIATIPYSQTLNYTGYPAPVWSVLGGSLPLGLTLDQNAGMITGTPTTPGSYSFTITADNGSTSSSKTFALEIGMPVVQEFGKWPGGPAEAIIDAELDMFKQLVVSGTNQTLILNVDYTLRSGSTIITFTESYLSTLQNGAYYYVAEFEDITGNDFNSTQILLTIDRGAGRAGGAGGTTEGGRGGPPVTGDNEPLILYFAAVFLSLSLIIVCILSLIIDRTRVTRAYVLKK
jgi:hypothetical protein